jgi:hypothetical protein
MITTEMPSQCPHCGFKHEAATSAYGDDIPTDGNVTMCFQCGRFSIIDSTRIEGMRVPTPNEKFEIRHSAICEKLHFAWMLAKAQKTAKDIKGRRG